MGHSSASELGDPEIQDASEWVARSDNSCVTNAECSLGGLGVDHPRGLQGEIGVHVRQDSTPRVEAVTVGTVDVQKTAGAFVDGLCGVVWVGQWRCCGCSHWSVKNSQLREGFQLAG